MNQEIQSAPKDAFAPLARAAFPSDSATPDGITIHRIQDILAALLAAAARGEGWLQQHELQLTPNEIEALKSLPNLIALDQNLVLLPRYAFQIHALRNFFSSQCLGNMRQSDDASIRENLNDLVPEETLTDRTTHAIVFSNIHQRIAIAGLVDAKVGVLTGGPGTGKTTTAAAIIALKQRLHPSLTPERVLVAAPTGKAACRIAEALARSTTHLKNLSDSEKLFLHSIRCLTLHRALEWSPEPPENGGPFRRNALRPLDVDLVLVDEASMVDLSLMQSLVRALPPHASLLLLGDSDQLQSVDVGGILAELVHRAAMSRNPPTELISLLESRLQLSASQVVSAFNEGLPQFGNASPSTTDLTPLEGLAFGLKYSRRAMNAPWILRLADATRPGSGSSISDVESLFLEEQMRGDSNLQWLKGNGSRFTSLHCKPQWTAWTERAHTWTQLLAGHDDPFRQDQARRALDALSDFQLLCSTNEQVQVANEAGCRILAPDARLHDGRIHHGCPILVTANNRSLGLSNGDVGIALSQTPDQPAMAALFPGPDGKPRILPLAQLPTFQPAFGLTIHKSQGSEWKHIVIQLPNDPTSGLLSRNLLYTAITRSSSKVELIGDARTLESILAT